MIIARFLSISFFIIVTFSAVAQFDLNFSKKDKIEVSTKYENSSLGSSREEYYFVYPDGMNLYIRTCSVGGMKPSSHTVTAYLFDASGKLKSTVEKSLASDELDASRIVGVYQMNGHAIVVTKTNGRQMDDFALWEIGDDLKFQKRAELKSVKWDCVQDVQSHITASDNGQYLGIITGSGGKVFLFDKELQKIYDKVLIKTANNPDLDGSRLDNFAISNSGNISISLLVEEKQKNLLAFAALDKGSWLLLSVDPRKDEVKPWNLAATLGVGYYSSNSSKFLELPNGETAFLYGENNTEDPKFNSLVHFLRIDHGLGEISQDRTVEVEGQLDPAMKAVNAYVRLYDASVTGKGNIIVPMLISNYDGPSTTNSFYQALVLDNTGAVVASKQLSLSRIQNSELGNMHAFLVGDKYYLYYQADKDEATMANAGQMNGHKLPLVKVKELQYCVAELDAGGKACKWSEVPFNSSITAKDKKVWKDKNSDVVVYKYSSGDALEMEVFGGKK